MSMSVQSLAGRGTAPVLDQLRSATRALHDRVETRPVMRALMQPRIEAADYVDCLRHLAQWHLALEPSVAQWLEDVKGLELSMRRKTPQLQQDLAHFGCTLESAGGYQFGWRNAAEAWGALYVIEGATLGGVVVTQRLETQPWLADECGRRFFAGYGARTGLMWKSFRQQLANAADGNQSFCDDATRAACHVFEALDQRLAAPPR